MIVLSRTSAACVYSAHIFMIVYGMFGFLIKKTFFDMWDNLIRIVILNLGFILAFGIMVYFPWVLKDYQVLNFLARGIGIGVLFVYAGAASTMTSMIADYGKPGN